MANELAAQESVTPKYFEIVATLKRRNQSKLLPTFVIVDHTGSPNEALYKQLVAAAILANRWVDFVRIDMTAESVPIRSKQIDVRTWITIDKQTVAPDWIEPADASVRIYRRRSKDENDR